MSMQTPELLSYFNEQTMLSILVPEGWDGQIEDPRQFRIFGPAAAELDHYRSSMSFVRGEAQGYGTDWLEHLVQQSEQEMRASYHAFQIVREQRFMLSSLAPIYARWYEWHDEETDLHFSQIQALILSHSLYLINAATQKPLASHYIPLFETILHSIRIIPPRR